MERLPRLGKRELICLLLFTCNYVVSVLRDFLFLWVLGMGYVILLWHSLSLPYIYIYLLFSLPSSMKKIQSKMKAPESKQDFPHYNPMGVSVAMKTRVPI